MDVVVEFDYEAEEKDELTIKEGDVVHNVRQFEEGWYIGTLNGAVGVFPDNFVRKLETANGTATNGSGTVQQNEATIESHEPKVSTTAPKSNHGIGIGFGNIFSGKPIQLKQASVKQMVKSMDVKENGKKSERVRARSNHDASRRPDELELRVDDLIDVIEHDLPGSRGWSKGHNLRTDKVGVFPSNLVVSVDNNDQPKLTDTGSTSQSLGNRSVSSKTITLQQQNGSVGPVVTSISSNTLVKPINTKSDLLAPNPNSTQGAKLGESGDLANGHDPDAFAQLAADRPKQTGRRLPSRFTTSNNTESSQQKPETTGNGSFRQNGGIHHFPAGGADQSKSATTAATIATGNGSGSPNRGQRSQSNQMRSPRIQPQSPHTRPGRASVAKPLQQSSTRSSSSMHQSNAAAAGVKSGSVRQRSALRTGSNRPASRESSDQSTRCRTPGYTPSISRYKPGGGGGTKTPVKARPASSVGKYSRGDTVPTNVHSDNFGKTTDQKSLLVKIKEQLDRLEAVQHDFMDSTTKKLQTLTSEVDQLKTDRNNTITEVDLRQAMLTDRIQLLTSEIDESRKERSADAVELSRMRKILIQLDSQNLSHAFKSTPRQHTTTVPHRSNLFKHTSENGEHAGDNTDRAPLADRPSRLVVFDSKKSSNTMV